jgi:hypothetical protein
MATFDPFLPLRFCDRYRRFILFADATVPTKTACRRRPSDSFSNFLKRRQLCASFANMAKRHFGQNQIVFFGPSVLSYGCHVSKTSQHTEIAANLSLCPW